MGNFMDNERRKALEGLASRNRHAAMILDRDVVVVDAEVRPLEEVGRKRTANRQKQKANAMRRKSRALRRSADAIDKKLDLAALAQAPAAKCSRVKDRK